MVGKKKNAIFAGGFEKTLKKNTHREEYSMLGINSPREPITPEFSREIRAALWRATTGNLNAEEKAACRRSHNARKKWKIVWETK